MELTTELVEQKATDLLTQARAITVSDADEYRRAGEFIVACKDMEKEVQAYFKPMKDAAFKAHRTICDQETNTLTPIRNAMAVAISVALPWKQEQERIALEEKRKADEEARKAREAELLRAAELAEAFGDTEHAQELVEQAVETPRVPKFVSPVPKVAGLRTPASKYKFRLVDPDKVTRQFLLPDMKGIEYAVSLLNRHKTPNGISAPQAEIEALQARVGGIEIYLDRGEKF